MIVTFSFYMCSVIVWKWVLVIVSDYKTCHGVIFPFNYQTFMLVTRCLYLMNPYSLACFGKIIIRCLSCLYICCVIAFGGSSVWRVGKEVQHFIWFPWNIEDIKHVSVNFDFRFSYFRFHVPFSHIFHLKICRIYNYVIHLKENTCTSFHRGTVPYTLTLKQMSHLFYNMSSAKVQAPPCISTQTDPSLPIWCFCGLLALSWGYIDSWCHTKQMHRLVCIFTGQKNLKTGFLMMWFRYKKDEMEVKRGVLSWWHIKVKSQLKHITFKLFPM